MLAVVAVAAVSYSVWGPPVQRWVTSVSGSSSGENKAPAADEHEGRDHAAHDDANSIELSPQAWKNLGLNVGPVELSDFERTITVPALVVERPGRTTIQVAAPLTGMVLGVFVAQGQSVQPGDLLFNLRLTHEDLVQTQTEFLKTLESLDVENREIERLKKITQGAVAGKVILDREYEKQKLEGLLRAQHEALLLHGLSEEQVQQISKGRRLLRELAVRAPEVVDHEEERRVLSGGQNNAVAQASHSEDAVEEHPLVVQNLTVHQGDVVEAGSPLCELADLKVLYAEGRGFEQDAQQVIRAAENEWPVKAVFQDNANQADVVTGLRIAYVANQVQAESRAFHFYVTLPNAIQRSFEGPAGRPYVAWKYKLGQRLNLLTPVERWSRKIVLPVQAIAQEGAENYVFVRDGKHFDRRPVHVEYRDPRNVVLANDGSLFPGEHVALSSAHQLQMAIKNKSGGGVDPHAGHNH
jgi:multidrug efflux pump subunit AcrA (membrane-fusion protein)